MTKPKKKTWPTDERASCANYTLTASAYIVDRSHRHRLVPSLQHNSLLCYTRTYNDELW